MECNPFQDLIYSDVCCPFSNLCSSSLSKLCANYSAQQLEYNVPASNICGCYLPNNEYQKYVDEFQVNVECTPLCNRPGVIPLTNPDGSAVRCRQDICIIDDLAIGLTTTNITGDINITQMCANCSNNSAYSANQSASCNCTIDANQINVTGNEIGNISINNTCTSTNCSLTNPLTGLVDIIPCSQIPNQRTIYDQEYAKQQAILIAERNQRNYTILGIMLVTILIIGLLFYFLNYRTKTPDNNDRDNKPVEQDKDLTSTASGSIKGGSFSQGYMEGTQSLSGFNVEGPFRSIN